jgi:hypothetical protein
MIASACSHVQEAEVYHSPTSMESPEKIYTYPSEEWYSESSPRKSPSPATTKKLNKEIAALTSHSSDPKVNDWDPIRTTPDEIAAWCAEYERGQRGEMAKRRRLENLLKVYIRFMRAQKLPGTDALLAAIRAMSTPETLARKGCKGFAPRLVAGCIDTSSSKDEDQALVLKEIGVSPALHVTTFCKLWCSESNCHPE